MRTHGMFPGLTADALALVARFLPGPGPRDSEREIGREVESPVTRSPLTALNQRAAEELNEHVDQRPAPRNGDGMEHDAPATEVITSAEARA